MNRDGSLSTEFSRNSKEIFHGIRCVEDTFRTIIFALLSAQMMGKVFIPVGYKNTHHV